LKIFNLKHETLGNNFVAPASPHAMQRTAALKAVYFQGAADEAQTHLVTKAEAKDPVTLCHQLLEKTPSVQAFYSTSQNGTFSWKNVFDFRKFKVYRNWKFYASMGKAQLSLPLMLKALWGEKTPPRLTCASRLLSKTGMEVPIPMKIYAFSDVGINSPGEVLPIQYAYDLLSAMAEAFAVSFEHSGDKATIDYLNGWADALGVNAVDKSEAWAQVVKLGIALFNCFSSDESVRKAGHKELRDLKPPLSALIFWDQTLLHADWSPESFDKALKKIYVVYNNLEAPPPQDAAGAPTVIAINPSKKVKEEVKAKWEHCQQYTQDLQETIFDLMIDRYFDADTLETLHQAIKDKPLEEQMAIMSRLKELPTSRIHKDLETLAKMQELREKGFDFKECRLAPVLTFSPPKESLSEALPLEPLALPSSEHLPEAYASALEETDEPTPYQPLRGQNLADLAPGQGVWMANKVSSFQDLAIRLLKDTQTNRTYLFNQNEGNTDNPDAATRALVDNLILNIDAYNRDAAIKNNPARLRLFYQKLRSQKDWANLMERFDQSNTPSVVILDLQKEADPVSTLSTWKMLFHFMEKRQWPSPKGMQHKPVTLILRDHNPERYETEMDARNIRRKVVARRPVIMKLTELPE
jgi:hypothetical protein